MNRTRIIGIGLFIIGTVSVMEAGNDADKTMMKNLGGLLFLGGLLIYWFGLVGELENPSFALFD